MSDPRPTCGSPRPARGAHSRPTASLPATLALTALLAAACTSGTAPTASPSGPLSPGLPGSVPVASGPPTVVPGEGDVPQPVIDQAIADAAGRAGVDPSEVTVVSAEARTWPSGALGCPEPGYLYTDVITPGYRVVVEAGGRQYDYRATQRGQGDIRWCERPPAGGLTSPGG